MATQRSLCCVVESAGTCIRLKPGCSKDNVVVIHTQLFIYAFKSFSALQPALIPTCSAFIAANHMEIALRLNTRVLSARPNEPPPRAMQWATPWRWLNTPEADGGAADSTGFAERLALVSAPFIL